MSDEELAAIEVQVEEARELARRLLEALNGCMAMEVTRPMTAYQAGQAEARIRLFFEAQELMATWEEQKP